MSFCTSKKNVGRRCGKNKVCKVQKTPKGKILRFCGKVSGKRR